MPSRPAAVLLTLLSAVSALAGPAAAPAGAVEEGNPALAVTGFVLESSPSTVVTRDADALATATVAGLALSRDGSTTTEATADAHRMLEAAHSTGVRAELLLSNFSNRLGDFDTRAAHLLLTDADHRERVARRLAREVRTAGWDGVNVDLEALRTVDAAGLVALVRDLSERLPADREVSIDISARSSLDAYRQAGYRLGAIGRAVDVLQLMTYDLHGPTWSAPGPIGPLAWQRRAASTVLEVVPAAKMDLGVAGYGYVWTGHRTGHNVTVAGARRLVEEDGASAVFDDEAGEWTATLSNGDVLWWSDGQSFDLRRDLAGELGVHGLALWRLGSADPLVS